MNLNNYTFKNKSKKSDFLLIIGVVTLSLLIGFTIAFFASDIWSSMNVQMSGPVRIEAVGAGTSYTSIEDTGTTNLIITLDEEYEVLIPGMPISVPANVKVYRSTTKPLMRAKVDIDVLDMDLNIGATDSLSVASDLYVQMTNSIESNHWYLHSDSYFYYIGEYVSADSNSAGGGYLTW